jgi:hypothetical protein
MIMPKDDNIDVGPGDDDLVDDEPIPARRDIRIFHRKKDDTHKKEPDHKNEEFDEDVFV